MLAGTRIEVCMNEVHRRRGITLAQWITDVYTGDIEQYGKLSKKELSMYKGLGRLGRSDKDDDA